MSPSTMDHRNDQSRCAREGDCPFAQRSRMAAACAPCFDWFGRMNLLMVDCDVGIGNEFLREMARAQNVWRSHVVGQPPIIIAWGSASTGGPNRAIQRHLSRRIQVSWNPSMHFGIVSAIMVFRFRTPSSVTSQNEGALHVFHLSSLPRPVHGRAKLHSTNAQALPPACRESIPNGERSPPVP